MGFQDDKKAAPPGLPLYGDFLLCQALRTSCLSCREIKPRAGNCRQVLTRNSWAAILRKVVGRMRWRGWSDYSFCIAVPDNSLLIFFPFIFISWRLITLQYCSSFCHTLTWISHGFTCIPHPNPPSHLPLHPIVNILSVIASQHVGSHVLGQEREITCWTSCLNFAPHLPIEITEILIKAESRSLGPRYRKSVV